MKSFSYAAMMIGKLDIATLSKLLGHKSLKMTMRYAHLAPAHLTKAGHVMDEVYQISSDAKLAHSPVSEQANTLTSY